MKNTIYLKLTSAILLFVLLFNSCRQEGLQIEQEKLANESAFKITLLNSGDFETNKLLKNKIIDLKENRFKTNNSLVGKNSSIQDSILDGAIIETNKIIEITNGEKKTYTFPVSRTYPNNKVENLVLKKNADNTYSGVLIQYTLSAGDKQQASAGQAIDLTSKMKIFQIDQINVTSKIQTNVVGCLEIKWETGYCNSGQHASGSDSDCVVGGAPDPSIISISNLCDDEPAIATTDYSDGTSIPGGGFGGASGAGGGGSGPSSGNPYNTFIFSSTDDDFNPCADDDIQCAIDWSNQVYTINYFNSLGKVGTDLSAYSPIFFYVKSYLTAGSPENILTERLNYIGNWFKLQDNSTDAKRLDNYKFSHWALRFFMNSDPKYFNYFQQNPADLNDIKFTEFDYTLYDDTNGARQAITAFSEFLIAGKNNTLNQLNFTDLVWQDAKDYLIQKMKSNIPAGIKYAKIIYNFSEAFLIEYPLAHTVVNGFVDFIRAGVASEVPFTTNPQFMKWNDILICWLFELGDFPVNDSTGYGNIPTIGFAGADYTISGVPNSIIPMRHLTTHKVKNGIADPNSVMSVRAEAIARIQQNNLNSFDREWVFGSDATIDTITKLDGLQFCLGSYQTNVNITSLGNNQYKLTFIIKNKTGWQSGTRGLNDYDGNPLNDSVIPDKPRGIGIRLGGTIGQTYGWTETVTVN